LTSLFVNDIANLFNDGNCACQLYADDLKLYYILEANVDISYLQDKLTNVYDWSDIFSNAAHWRGLPEQTQSKKATLAC